MPWANQQFKYLYTELGTNDTYLPRILDAPPMNHLAQEYIKVLSWLYPNQKGTVKCCEIKGNVRCHQKALYIGTEAWLFESYESSLLSFKRRNFRTRLD